MPTPVADTNPFAAMVAVPVPFVIDQGLPVAGLDVLDIIIVLLLQTVVAPSTVGNALTVTWVVSVQLPVGEITSNV